MTKNNWFEVDKKGLRELQAGKPKHYILRELIQNAFDEPITECRATLKYNKGKTTIKINDDSPIGFRDLRDSYTLFKHTYKRKNPEKRGRFNVGEKQAFSICESARVETTKGTIIFDKKGRRKSSKKTDKGTRVIVEVKSNKKEFEEMLSVIKTYLVPRGISFIVNEKTISFKEPYKVFEAKLITEIEQDNILKRTIRKTKVHILKSESPFLYEMGIPVQKIECEFGIDVQQKIPLSIDRETISPSFLRDLYAEVLNQTYEEIETDDSSQIWIREGISDDRISKEAVESIMEKRFGKKVCVANPFDKQSIDEAISRGYNVVYGSEMSKEEWDKVKENNLISSSSDLFGTNFTNAESIKPNKNQKRVEEYAKKIAKRLLNLNLNVEFVKGGVNMVVAQFGGNTLTFNVSKLRGFFDEPISSRTTDLILHELGHYAGMHTERKYLDLITKMSGELVMTALKEPEFFKVGG